MASLDVSDGHMPSDLREMVENLTSTTTGQAGAGSASIQQSAWLAASALPQPASATVATSGATSSRTSPAQHAGRHPWLMPRRGSSRGHHHHHQQQQSHQQTSDLSDWDNGQRRLHSPPPTNIFAAQNRSIFASGPPTASVSANTAHASMSSPPSSADSPSSLTNLSASAAFSFRRSSPHSSQPPQAPRISSPVRSLRIAGIEKETDDPSSSARRRMSTHRGERSTPAAVSSLFAAPDSTSPTISRHGSYAKNGVGGSHHARGSGANPDTAPLPNHLYTRGLLSGRHSDITVVAFGTKYPLHRLLLDRAPYFSSALSEPWLESSAKEITLHPEEIDANITQGAFELALKRIYGCHKEEEEDKEAIGLFATGCWLEMVDLIEASLTSLMRQLCSANISTYIRLVTNNYYGKHGDRILTAAKAMLCREGWEMPLRCFEGVPGDIIREVMGSDGFYVPNEWDRFIMAKRLLDRRLRDSAFEGGLIDAHGKQLVPLPRSIMGAAIRFNIVASTSQSTTAADTNDKWLNLYYSPDVSPILALLDEGIHYMHMSFEQLQKIKTSKDVLGLPLLPDHVVADALWMSMELRQRVLNAGENDLELGITDYVDSGDSGSDSTASDTTADGKTSGTILGKQQDSAEDSEEEEPDSDDFCVSPRKFWVPLQDATYPVAGNMESDPSQSTTPYSSRQYSRASGAMITQDLHWATDFASSLQDRPDTPPDVANGPSPKVRYSTFPPFRFSVEFPAAKNLKEKKRTYSSTVWYAGNLWNVYVQKTVGTRHTALGVYLHREKQVESSDDGSLPKLLNLSVDERIDQLEREMTLARSSSHRNTADTGGNPLFGRGGEDGDDASNDVMRLSNTLPRPSQDLSTLSGLVRSSRGVTKSSEATGLRNMGLGAHDLAMARVPSDDGNDNSGEGGQYRINEAFPFERRRRRVATLPPYVDARATTRTYHKIYSPSRSGRLLTVYESGPDKFNISQSWGWKSSNLILDDALGDEGEEQTREPRLRFMIVIGNV